MKQLGIFVFGLGGGLLAIVSACGSDDGSPSGSAGRGGSNAGTGGATSGTGGGGKGGSTGGTNTGGKGGSTGGTNTGGKGGSSAGADSGGEGGLGDAGMGGADAGAGGGGPGCEICVTEATCSGDPPSCECPDGYEGDGTEAGSGCTDIDECTTGAHDCLAPSAHGVCTDTDGGFTCSCEMGYDGDGTTTGTGCTNVDECTEGTSDCVPATANGVCTDTDGGFTCGCEAGYAGDGTTGGTGCTDIDECDDGVDNCDNFTCVNTGGSFECSGLYATEPFTGVLARLDPATFGLLDLMRITSTGAVTGVNGLARHPTTGTIYVVAKVGGVGGRAFGTLDFETGVISVINSVDSFSSLTFTPDGTLYGTTGDGASVPESLYSFDLTTGVPTLVGALGNGADGEVVCYNPDDSLMYHWSGNAAVVMESFPLATPLVFTNISPDLPTVGEIFGCRYVGNNTFLVYEIASRVFHVTTTGAVTAVPGAVANMFTDVRATEPATMTVPHTARPTSGPAAGGTTVTLRGIGLTGANAVSFGGVAATSFTVVDSTTITAEAPAVAASTVDIVVSLPGLTFPATWPAAFTFE